MVAVMVWVRRGRQLEAERLGPGAAGAMIPIEFSLGWDSGLTHHRRRFIYSTSKRRYGAGPSWFLQ